MRFRLVGVVALMAMVIASCGGTTPEAGGPSEGIQVHGDWTIDIYNEDGSLDRHIVFENDLTDTGDDLLANLLSGERYAGFWQIEFNAGSQSLSPCLEQGFGSSCFIQTSPGTDNDLISYNLEVSASSGVLVLSGSHPVGRDGEINTVRTWVEQCTPGLQPECPGTPTGLTEKLGVADPDTGSPYVVSEGQLVEIRVEISFTSG